MVDAKDGYDISGTLAVVGGVLFSIGVGLRSSLSSDDAVHWMSWVSLFLIGGCSVAAMVFGSRTMGSNKFKNAFMYFTWTGFAVVSLYIAIESIMDHDAHEFASACKDGDKTALEGPAIMEIGSAGMPALDSIAAVAFTLAIGSALFTRSKLQDKGDEAKTVDTVSRFLATFMFVIATIFTIKYTVDTENTNPFHADVCNSTNHQEDIEDDRKSVYGFITTGMALVALSAIIRLPQTDKPLGEDFVEKLHTVLSTMFAGLIFVGAFWACVNTNYFGDHSGVNGFCQYTCDSAVGEADGWNIKPTLSNTFFSFILPFSLSMAWRAFRQEEEADEFETGL
jgi:hypothetical protein